MPELPEVENIRKTLSTEVKKGDKLISITFLRSDLRFQIPQNKLENLLGHHLLEISRRGKYLLFTFDNGIMVSHLGMTGRWLINKMCNKNYLPAKHDHVILKFNNGNILIYNDPRRFGYIEFVRNKNELMNNQFFKHLGKEPFEKDMDGKYLYSLGLKSNRAVKIFLMDQEVVVGVGNIYASEVLYLAKINPHKITKSIKPAQWEDISQAIKKILKVAIEKGGSTIKDYRKSDGSQGEFQNQFAVYGKAGKPCFKCNTSIKSAVLGGRATYWCPKCQKN